MDQRAALGVDLNLAGGRAGLDLRGLELEVRVLVRDELGDDLGDVVAGGDRDGVDERGELEPAEPVDEVDGDEHAGGGASHLGAAHEEHSERVELEVAVASVEALLEGELGILQRRERRPNARGHEVGRHEELHTGDRCGVGAREVVDDRRSRDDREVAGRVDGSGRGDLFAADLERRDGDDGRAGGEELLEGERSLSHESRPKSRSRGSMISPATKLTR